MIPCYIPSIKNTFSHPLHIGNKCPFRAQLFLKKAKSFKQFFLLKPEYLNIKNDTKMFDQLGQAAQCAQMTILRKKLFFYYL